MPHHITPECEESDCLCCSEKSYIECHVMLLIGGVCACASVCCSEESCIECRIMLLISSTGACVYVCVCVRESNGDTVHVV